MNDEQTIEMVISVAQDLTRQGYWVDVECVDLNDMDFTFELSHPEEDGVKRRHYSVRYMYREVLLDTLQNELDNWT